MKREKAAAIPVDGGTALRSRPFAKLSAAVDAAPPALPPNESRLAPLPPVDAPAVPWGEIARATVHVERQGRGGKTVTVACLEPLPPEALAPALAALQKLLGCGGALDGGRLILQGDQRRRLVDLLEKSAPRVRVR
ncbi:MAG: translation initiation factor [Candidatus Schekmanbacteria bacterium]|nr:translation initiation factor [Candidatus Schekmanbacteria bacterium]